MLVVTVRMFCKYQAEAGAEEYISKEFLPSKWDSLITLLSLFGIEIALRNLI